ncbi:hypothetical protein GCM10020256_28550 [Streptomyces thermocoprophilus]
MWMKPDAAFWKAQLPGPQGNAAAELFKDRYVHGTTENDLLKGMAETCDLAEFQHEVEGEVTDEAELTKGAETTRDGTDVIPLSSTDDGKEHVLYVTSDEPHLLAEATEKSGSAGKETFIDLRFDDYDKPVPSKTPPPGRDGRGGPPATAGRLRALDATAFRAPAATARAAPPPRVRRRPGRRCRGAALGR